MIAHVELYAIYAGCAGLVWFLGWWTRGPRVKSLDDAFDRGAGQEIDLAIERVEREGMVLRLSPNGKAVWCDAGSQWDRDGANAPVGFDEPQSVTEQLPVANEGHPGPGRYPDGREYPTAPGTVNAELAALAAESNGEPPEPIAVHLDETTEQWTARMEMEAAIWCAENGVERERAGSWL